MRPKLRIVCPAVGGTWERDDPRDNDADTLILSVGIGGVDREFPWPTDARGRAINPWEVNAQFFGWMLASRYGRPGVAAAETWRDRPPLL